MSLLFAGFILGVDATSDIEESVATVLPTVVPICQGMHEWDIYIAATYSAVEGKICYKC